MASKISGSGDLISDRYASALYDLASESQVVDSILKDFNLLKKIIKESKELNLLIKSPLISSSDKLIIFEKILLKQEFNKITNTFLKVISKNKRFAHINSIIERFININSEKRGDMLADVTSAEDLSDNQKNIIKDKLKNILGEKLSLNYKVDKKIIGGLIVKVGSKMIDSSLASKINKLKIAMRGT